MFVLIALLLFIKALDRDRPLGFVVAIWVIGAPNPPNPNVALKNWSLQSFTADFTTGADGSLILYFTPNKVDVFGRVPF